MQPKKSAGVNASVYARSALAGSPSIDRQTATCKQFAARGNVELDPAHVYMDDGASGSTLNLRPALTALLAAANSRPQPFNVVIIESSFRLARNTITLASLIDKLAVAGVAVIFVSDQLDSRNVNFRHKFRPLLHVLWPRRVI